MKEPGAAGNSDACAGDGKQRVKADRRICCGEITDEGRSQTTAMDKALLYLK